MDKSKLVNIGRYKYAYKMKSGKWSVYEGEYSDRAEDRVTGLTVVRGDDGKPLRFDSLKEAEDRFKWK